MTQMTSTATMIERLSGLLGTKELTDWEQQFVQSVSSRAAAGQVTKLSERQVEILDALHARHFA